MGKKRKAYFNNAQKEKKAKLKFGNLTKLSPGMKGFLITYNCKFTFCLNESKKLLQQFSLPNENLEKSQEKSGNDLEKLLKEETDSLNKRDKEFAVLDTGAKYTIFINLDSVDPNLVVESIFEHIETTKRPLGRYVQRLLPIINTCKAHLDEIEKCLILTLDKLEAIKKSESENDSIPFKYCCIYKSSNNASLSRESIFKMIGTYLQSKNKSNKVDFDKPDYVILIQVICNMCFISMVRNYFDYKKYNLVEQGNKFNEKINTQPQISTTVENQQSTSDT